MCQILDSSWHGRSLLWLFDQPHLGNLAVASVATKTRFPEPTQRQVATRSGGCRDFELQRFDRKRPGDVGMHLEVVICDEPNPFLKTVAAINHAQLVTGFG